MRDATGRYLELPRPGTSGRCWRPTRDRVSFSPNQQTSVTDPGSVPTIQWLEDGNPLEALWRSHNGAPPPSRAIVTDGKMTADEAYGLACQGTALLWRGDFQEARQMLSALGKRADRRQRRSQKSRAAPAQVFHLYRQARSQRARTLNMLLI